MVELARDADLLMADASFIEQAPDRLRGWLGTARDAGRQATEADAGCLLLTHLMPGTDHDVAQAATREHYTGPVGVAEADLEFDLR